MIRRTSLAAAAVVATGILAACSATTPTTDETAAGESFKVGILEIVHADVSESVRTGFVETLESELGDAASVEFDIKNANGDQSLITSIAREFADSDYDAFAVIGTPAVIAVAAQITDRPIFALAMGDPVGAGLAESLEAPGGNVTGSIDYIDPALLLDDLRELHPDLTSIGRIYAPSNQNLQVWVAALRTAIEGTGIELVESTVAASSEVAQGARALIDRADVILVGPDAMVIAGMDAVGAAMSGASMPLYVVGGDVSVPGVLGSLGPDYAQLGVGAGAGAAKVLLGADPGTVPFAVPQGLDIVLNQTLADQYGIVVPDSLTDRTTYQ